jgi:putative DNA primase/helicase
MEAAEKFARSSLDARRLQAALLLAQSELPVTPAELDTNPRLLNFLNGVVDLETGELSRHRRSDMITKLVHYNYNPEAKCLRWEAFLREIMGGGPGAGEGSGPGAGEGALKRADELVNFLQVGLGYSITGEVSEKAIFVAHGSGDNGKTTMLSVVRELVSEYAVTMGLDVLTARDESNNVAAARASLRGVRFAVSNETEEGQRFSAARLKRICQGPGGEIEACKKYENPIRFPESHKIWIDGNHKPELPASDVAVWSRLRLVPFTVTFPKDQQDPKLKATLLEEAEGILAWLVAGATRWYAKGLPKSKIIDAATGAWREELDRLAQYLAEYTERSDDKEAYLRNKVLYGAYKGWCEENGERWLSHIRFSRQMEAMEYRKGERDNEGNTWLGIRFTKPV